MRQAREEVESQLDALKGQCAESKAHPETLGRQIADMERMKNDMREDFSRQVDEFKKRSRSEKICALFVSENNHDNNRGKITMPIDYKKFIHPEDKAALEKLKSIPLLDTAVKKYLKYVTEDVLHGMNMASKIQLGPNQLPDIYAILTDVCTKLQIPVPEFYLEMDPNPNAYTSGDTKPFVVVNSGIIDLLQPDELKAVIAHECGHILCHHVLYHMLADIILSTGGGIASVFGAGIITEPFKWALTYWVRRSEFSADRVAAYVMGDADIVARTMMRLAGGGTKITASVNMEEFLRQAAEYNKFLKDSDKSSFLQNWMIKDIDHPYPAVRAAEVIKWFKSSTFADHPSKLIGEIGNAKLNW